jgi:WD40 repeat protein
MLEVESGKELWQVPRWISSTGQDFYGFTPDGKTLLVAGGALGTVIHRYETATGKRLLAPGEPSDTSREIAFHPDERTVYTLGGDGSVLRSWETRTGKEKSAARLDIRWGKFSPDGQLLAGIKGDAIHVLESSTGKERWRLKAVPGVKPGSWSFSPDGKLLAVYGQQTQDKGSHCVLLWDLITGKELRRFSVKDSNHHFAFAPDGHSVIGQPWPSNTQESSDLRSWDVSTGQERLPLKLPPNNGIVALSPDGKTVALMQDQPSHILAFIEAATGQKRVEIQPSEVCRVWNWPPTATYSPDGSLFLLSDGEGQMQVLDAFSGQRLGTVSGRSGSFSSFSFSNSGRMLATLSSNDTTGLIWDANTILARLRVGPEELSPDVLSGLWDDLGSKDAARAYQALGRLILAPRQTTAWLRERLKPFSTVQIDKKHLDELLVKLDSDEFAVREQATKEIEKFGLQALPALEKVLAAHPSIEVRKRIGALTEKIGPERLRPLRGVETLEHIGSPQAQEVLKTLAQGAPEARLTQEAKASLERLTRRSTDSSEIPKN